MCGSVLQPKYCHEDIRDGVDVLVSRDIADTRVRRSHLRCERQRLLDGQRREVDVTAFQPQSIQMHHENHQRAHSLLGTVRHITSETLLDFLRGERVIVPLARDGMILLRLIGESLEESRTARARTPQNH